MTLSFCIHVVRISMSNLHGKIFQYHIFNGKSVPQLVNGYINISVLCPDLEQLFAYAMASKGNAYICLIADELAVSPKDLIIVYRNHYWMHPKIAAHFALSISDEYFSFVLDCLKLWAAFSQVKTSDLTIPDAFGDVCDFLRRCYRVSCEEII